MRPSFCFTPHSFLRWFIDTMSAVSATDNSFLALSYVGTGKKFWDVPDFVHAAFGSLSTLPSIINTIILPNTSVSVLALVAYSLPAKTPVRPLPAPILQKKIPTLLILLQPCCWSRCQFHLKLSLTKLSGKLVKHGWMDTNQSSTPTSVAAAKANSRF